MIKKEKFRKKSSERKVQEKKRKKRKFQEKSLERKVQENV